MRKHAEDLARVLDNEEIGRAVMVGVSIGGYILFEFWRQHHARVAALVLANTRAQADTPEARVGRLQSASEVLQKGTEPFVEGFLPKALGRTTIATRPDLVDGARRMMLKMSPEDISLVQRGMAERPDSVPTLKTINVPALVIAGEEDGFVPLAEAELMRHHIAGGVLKVIPRAGHYSPWEQPDAVGLLLRQFVESLG